jgi:hypothetical protein
VFEASGGVDGRVSLEVLPELAAATDGTVSEGLRLAKAVERANVMIKVPATPEGIPAIRALTAAGVSVNVTLIFSLQRYGEVIDAYLAGPGAGQGGWARPVPDPLGGVLLRQPGGRGSRRQAGQAGHRRGVGAARQGGHRQRAAGL